MARPAPVAIVVSVEGDTQEPLGAYVGVVEDVVKYRTLDNEYRQAPADCVAIVTVDALAGIRPQPAVNDLAALHTALRALIEHIDNEANVPARYESSHAAALAESDARALAAAAAVVHRFKLGDKYPNVSETRYFAPGRGPSQ